MTDRVNYVIHVLKHAFNELCRVDASRRVCGLARYGTKLADYLVRQIGWKAHYWSPNVSHPNHFNYQLRDLSYWNTLRRGVYHVGSYNTNVPVSGHVVNNSKTGIKVRGWDDPTVKAVEALTSDARAARLPGDRAEVLQDPERAKVWRRFDRGGVAGRGCLP